MVEQSSIKGRWSKKTWLLARLQHNHGLSQSSISDSVTQPFSTNYVVTDWNELIFRCDKRPSILSLTAMKRRMATQKWGDGPHPS